MPNPTPVTTEQDCQHVHAEGVKLASGMWGEESDPVKEDLWKLTHLHYCGNWVAAYRTCINIGALQ